MCTAQPTTVVRHPARSIHGSYPALLPLRVPGKAVERQGGARGPSIPTACHHTCVNHSKATEERGGVRCCLLGVLTPKMAADHNVGRKTAASSASSDPIGQSRDDAIGSRSQLTRPPPPNVANGRESKLIPLISLPKGWKKQKIEC